MPPIADKARVAELVLSQDQWQKSWSLWSELQVKFGGKSEKKSNKNGKGWRK